VGGRPAREPRARAALGDRLGGHIVQGHVDAVGVVEACRRRDDALLVDVRLPDELEPLMVPHGSVAVDGVSLTVNALPAPGILQLSLIEYTWTHTTLGALRAGRRRPRRGGHDRQVRPSARRPVRGRAVTRRSGPSRRIL
jgi:hypothetical protein